MINRRLLTAAALSLGFHAVLLTVVDLGPERKEERPSYPKTRVQLAAASDTAPVIAESVPEPHPAANAAASDIEVLEPESEPPEIQAPESEFVQSEIETSADPQNAADRTAGTAAPGEAVSSPNIENSRPSLITTIDPVYPIQARRLGVEGVVDLVVTVDSTGLPIECTIIPPRVHKVLEKSALAAVMQARFKPGMENGRPIQDSFRLKVRFELEA